jgi:hypothetical protein
LRIRDREAVLTPEPHVERHAIRSQLARRGQRGGRIGRLAPCFTPIPTEETSCNLPPRIRRVIWLPASAAEARTTARPRSLSWLAFVVAAITNGAPVGQRTLDQQHNVGRAGRADQILKQAGSAQSRRLTQIVVVQSRTATVADPALRAVIDGVTRRLRHDATVPDIPPGGVFEAYVALVTVGMYA